MDTYLTPDDFLIAESNGISYNVAYSRYYVYRWPKERAITTPVEKRDWTWKGYAETCAKNGISRDRFYTRMREGWTAEKASTTPFIPYHDTDKPKIRKVTQEIIKIAAENGIAENTLKIRIYKYKWTVEKAMTTPVNTRLRRKDYEATRARH